MESVYTGRDTARPREGSVAAAVQEASTRWLYQHLSAPLSSGPDRAADSARMRRDTCRVGGSFPDEDCPRSGLAAWSDVVLQDNADPTRGGCGACAGGRSRGRGHDREGLAPAYDPAWRPAPDAEITAARARVRSIRKRARDETSGQASRPRCSTRGERPEPSTPPLGGRRRGAGDRCARLADLREVPVVKKAELRGRRRRPRHLRRHLCASRARDRAHPRQTEAVPPDRPTCSASGRDDGRRIARPTRRTSGPRRAAGRPRC